MKYLVYKYLDYPKKTKTQKYLKVGKAHKKLCLKSIVFPLPEPEPWPLLKTDSGFIILVQFNRLMEWLDFFLISPLALELQNAVHSPIFLQRSLHLSSSPWYSLSYSKQILTFTMHILYISPDPPPPPPPLIAISLIKVHFKST